MDREALVARNISMTAAFHSTPYKHRLRGMLLRAVTRLPIKPGNPPPGDRILIIRPDHLGDMLLTTPAIHALRDAVPHAEIHAIVGPWSADILASYPEIDMILTLPFPGFSRSREPSLHSPYQLAIKAARQIRQIGYTTAIIARPDHWWGALIAYLAGIPERIGSDSPDVVPFLTHTIRHQHQHAVLQNMALVEKWTGPLGPQDANYYFPIEDRARAYVDGYLQEWGISPGQRVICVHPGSGSWVKRWDESRWASVADTLSDQLNSPVILTGGDHELPIIQAIVQNMTVPVCVMAGDTHISQLAALYARACVVLGPDSGPLHLAAAVGAPTVALFGPADPAEFRPWGAKERHIVLASDIACRPCRVLDWGGDNPENHPCVREISMGQVLEAARRVGQV